MILFQLLLMFFLFFPLGYILLDLLKYKTDSLYERIIISFGVGICLFILLTSIFDILRIPVFWLYHVIVISLITLLYLYFKKKQLLGSFKNKNKKLNYTDFLILLLFLIHLIIFARASLLQPAFENDDPWGVAINTAYVRDFKTYNIGNNEWRDGRSEPYAQGYHMVMGTLAQLSDSLSQTLKFFNSFFISLSILFMYFLINKIFNSKLMGFLAALSIFLNPSFLSRFIWAEALAVSLLILLLYFITQKSKQAIIFSGLIWGSIAILHQRTFLVTTTIMITYYLVVLIIISKESKFKFSFINIKKAIFNRISLVALLAFLFSLIYWGHQLFKPTIKFILERHSAVTNPYWSRAVISISDYFITKPYNDMANPSGIGTVMILVAVLGILLWKFLKNVDLEIKLFIPSLLIVLLILHQIGRFLPSPIPIITVWKFLAIPIAIFFAYGLLALKNLSFFKNQKIIYFSVILIIISLVFFNSGMPKYKVTTSTWPIGAIWVGGFETYKPYAYLQDLDPGSKVFTTGSTYKVIGLDFKADYTDMLHEIFKKDIYNKTEQEIHSFLKQNNYKYLMVDIEPVAQMGEELGLASLNNLLEEISLSDNFWLLHRSESAFLFRVG
jgi:hypothetical protein